MNIKITKNQLDELLIDEANNLNESFGGFKKDVKGLKLSNIVKGVRGVWSGEGYDYYRYLNMVRKNLRTIMKNDKANSKSINNLNIIKSDITNEPNIDNVKKIALKQAISDALGYYSRYQKVIKDIDDKISNKIK